jgi:hypothetical protein
LVLAQKAGLKGFTGSYLAGLSSQAGRQAQVRRAFLKVTFAARASGGQARGPKNTPINEKSTRKNKNENYIIDNQKAHWQSDPVRLPRPCNPASVAGRRLQQLGYPGRAHG